MIGVFDSGIGGLSVLREITKVLPHEDIVYYADSAHCPYGGKSREYVCNRARNICSFLREKGAELIVVACNTATAAAIETLRAESPDFPFVGMEPAIKPASFETKTGIVGVLATAGTLHASKYHDLKDRFSNNVRVVEHVGQGFVELVEKGILDGPEAEETIKASLAPLLAEGADTIVLGCTHYPFLIDCIRKVGGEDINIIDPAPAVANHVKHLLEEKGEIKNDSAKGRVTLFTSADQKLLESMYKRLIEA